MTISNEDDLTENLKERTFTNLSEKPNLKGDRLNFCLLTLLYVLQGFPIGLSSSIPMILQSKKMATYEDQALFSISVWPYSIKILWAPVVDALYSKWLGRRKSWLLPLQTLMGLCLIHMANNINEWLPESGKANLNMLIIMVFVINLLSATQDIVVDGWALTMMKKQNVGYASTCNSVGLPIGMFIGSVSFILLVSKEFNNKYLQTTVVAEGIISMECYLWVFGVMILVITLLVGLFKNENNSDVLSKNDFETVNVCQNYNILWTILKLPKMKLLAVALLTARIGFAAMDGVSILKLIDAGFPKDDIMILTTASYVIKFTMPIFVTNYITGPKPISYYLKVTPIRLLWALAYVMLIYFTPILIHKNETAVYVPVYYYFALGLVFLINEMLSFFMLLTIYAFFCRLSDPRFGGTYMTLFSTFLYSGLIVTNTLVLKLVSISTVKLCSNDNGNYCYTADLENSCKTNGGNCVVFVDGYYIAIAVCMVIGFVWYGVFRKIIINYQSLDIHNWLVHDRQTTITSVDKY
ncbi:Major facilitator superfamily domain,Acetyl-coenzyme A transporter 1 [Cinara cedri]|uniref:Major facilitator superfamily domain,Acetyl-coenzyme A transporter 1 n=1 Tax=Cinara cedri TaxID=506608 RepID=A0A5E4MFY6_9HEMI|nr:Major facilitator superfamily domain,Acetyl-coenzyme A transporter 1 [Cinara cedri]